MASFPVITSLFITLTVYLMLFNKQPFVLAASSGAVSLETTHRSRERPFMRFIPRKANQYARLKAESFGDFMGKLISFNKYKAGNKNHKWAI